MTSDRPRRVISVKTMDVVSAGNDMAARGHKVYIEAIREWFTERGLYVH